MKKHPLPDYIDPAAIQARIHDHNRWSESRAELVATRDQLQADVDVMEADPKYPTEADGQLLAAKREQIGMCDARIERCDRALNDLETIHFPEAGKALARALSECAGNEREQARKRYLQVVAPFMANVDRATTAFDQTDYVRALTRAAHVDAYYLWRLQEVLACLERYQETGSILVTEGDNGWKAAFA